MKKLLCILISLLFFASCCFAATTNSYDKYGSKTGSYKTNGNTVLLNAINMALKLPHTNEFQQVIIPMINMEAKPEVTRKLLANTRLTINMVLKQEALKRIQTV